MFNRAIVKQGPPKYLSSDNDPLFRFHQWLANLRILEVDEIKAIPCTPRSHAFVERLIGLVRHEFLDRTLFWNQGELERKLDVTKPITTNTAVTPGWPEPRRLIKRRTHAPNRKP
jgi:putative transposase